MATCTICEGAGVIEKDGQYLECECAEIRRIAASMPVFVRSAQAKEEHIKFLAPVRRGDLRPIRLIDAIYRSFFIISQWADMRSFIKLIMIRHRKKFLRITSDREIRDVYVGSASRSARGEDSKEPVYNSLQDLVETPDLLLIRLNELGYKNKAAPGALEESLCYRLDRNLPIWILSDASRPFGQGSFSYSENVWSIICSMDKFKIDPILPSSAPLNVSDVVGSTVQTGVQDSPLAPEPAPSRIEKTKTREKSDDGELKGFGGLGSGIKKSSRRH